MKKNSGTSRVLIVVTAVFILVTATLGYLSGKTYTNAQETFYNGGYILSSNTEDNNSVNMQCYFLSGTTYKKTIDEKITFNDINNNKVSIPSQNFIHYDDSALGSLNESVLLDTDTFNNDQISYYALTKDSILSKNGVSYQTNNAGETISFANFIWKISAGRYMLVSKTITLVVSEDSRQVFDDYIELEYIDEGVAHLVNQNGTYSTISSDAYLELENGVRIYIGSKNLSDGESVLMNLAQMVVDSDDDIESIPDEDYTIEIDKQPRIVVNVTDGKKGEDGQDAEDGESGTAGDAGNPGNAGNTGSAGKQPYQSDPADDADGHSYWYVYDYEKDAYVLTNIRADGEDGTKGGPGETGTGGGEGNKGDDGKTPEKREENGVNIWYVYDPTVGDYVSTGIEADGKSGTNGSRGSDGTPGSGGETGDLGDGGDPGTQGSPGDKGDSAKYSDYTYTAEKMPVFKLDEPLHVTAYSVNGTVTFDDNDCSTESAVFQIIETSSGNIIWKRNITDLTTSIDLNENKHAVSLLKQNTQYALVVNATYTPNSSTNPTTNAPKAENNNKGNKVWYIYNNATGQWDETKYSADNGDSDPAEPVEENGYWKVYDYSKGSFVKTDYLAYNKKITRQVFKEFFTTDNYGLTLEFDHATTSDIYANLHIDEKIIEDLSIELYDEDKVKLVCGVGEDYTFEIINDNEDIDYNYDANNNTFSLADEDIVEGTVTQVRFKGLDRNKKYYMLINVGSLHRNEDLGLIPAGSFEYVEAMTLKQTPVIEAPTASFIRSDSTLVVNPGKVTDIDAGIYEYRYEVYAEDTKGTKTLEDDTLELIYTAVSNNTSAVSISISTLTYDSSFIRVQTVGMFNNNEYVEEVRSPFSTPVQLTKVNWPSIELRDQIITASTAAGTIAIKDVDDIVDSDGSFTVKYESIETDAKSKPIDSGEFTVKVGESGSAIYVLENGKNGYKIFINYALKALKSNMQYKFTVIAEKVTTTEKDGTNQNPRTYTLSNEVVGTALFDTCYDSSKPYEKRYAPLYIKGYDTGDNSTQFSSAIYFVLGNDDSVNWTYDKENEKKGATHIYSDVAQAVLNMESDCELTAKALSYVTFEVYGAKLKDGTVNVYEPDLDNKLNDPNSPLVFRNYKDSSKLNELKKGLDEETITEDECRKFYQWDVQDYLTNNSSYNTEDKYAYANKYNFNSIFYRINTLSGKLYGSYLLKSESEAETYDDLDIESKIVISAKSFENDNVFKDKFNAYLSSNKNYPVFIKITSAYDYTYGDGGSSTKKYDSNTIQIGDTNNYTGGLDDKWVMAAVNTITPPWLEDEDTYINSEPITKSNDSGVKFLNEENTNNLYTEENTVKPAELIDDVWYVWNGETNEYVSTGVINDENINKPICKQDEDGVYYWYLYSYDAENDKVEYIKTEIKNGQRNCQTLSSTVNKTSLINSWTDLYSTTKVGFVFQGLTDWLAAYSDAVRYIVYDSDGNEVTRSYNAYDSSNDSSTIKNKLGFDGDEGWIPYTYTSSTELPKYYFFFDVDRNGESIKRGEEFTVRCEIRIKDKDNGGNNVYKIYPTDYLTPNEDYLIENQFIEAKQEPELSVIQYKGTINGVDEVYVHILDPDIALERTATEWTIYRGAVVVENATNVTYAPIDVNSDSSYDEHFYVTNMPITNAQLAYRYSVENGQWIEDVLPNETKLNKPKQLLVSSVDVRPNAVNEADATAFKIFVNLDVYQTGTTNFDPDKIITVDQVKAALKQADITFVNVTEGYANLSKTFEFKDPVSFATDFYSYEDTSGDEPKMVDKEVATTVIYSVEYSDLISIYHTGNGLRNYFNCLIDLYSDSGKYGIYYADAKNYKLLAQPNTFNTGYEVLANTSISGVDFVEKYVNIAEGGQYNVIDKDAYDALAQAVQADYAVYEDLTATQKEALYSTYVDKYITTNSVSIPQIDVYEGGTLVNSFTTNEITAKNISYDSETQKLNFALSASVLYANITPNTYTIKAQLSVNGATSNLECDTTSQASGYYAIDYAGDGTSPIATNKLYNVTNVEYKKHSNLYDLYVGNLNDSYNNIGLTYVPKEIVRSPRFIQTGLSFYSVLPTCTLDAVTGVYFSRMKINLYGENTLTASKGMLVKVVINDPENEHNGEVFAEIPLTKFGTQEFTANLDPDTGYDVYVYGYQEQENTHGGYSLVSLLEAPKHIQTLISLDVKETTLVKKYETNRNSATRNTKEMNYTVTLDQVYRNDIKRGVDNVVMEIFDSDSIELNGEDFVVKSGATPVATQQIGKQQFYDGIKGSNNQTPSSDFTKDDMSYTYSFDWKPSENHELGVDYYVRTTITYKDSSKTNPDEEVKVYDIIKIDVTDTEDEDNDIQKWTTSDYFNIIPTNDIEDDGEGHIDFFIKFTITAVDDKRVIVSNNKNANNPKNGAYIVELYKEGSGSDKDTKVKITDANGTEEDYLKVNANFIKTSLEAKDIICHNLLPSTNYYLKLYYYEDLSNVGILLPNTIEDLNADLVKTVNSEVHQTSSKNDIYVNSMTIIPELKYAVLDGNYLSYVKKIVYKLTDLKTGDVYTKTITNFTNTFYEKNDKYILKIDDLYYDAANEPAFDLIVYLYRADIDASPVQKSAKYGEAPTE